MALASRSLLAAPVLAWPKGWCGPPESNLPSPPACSPLLLHAEWPVVLPASNLLLRPEAAWPQRCTLNFVLSHSTWDWGGGFEPMPPLQEQGSKQAEPRAWLLWPFLQANFCFAGLLATPNAPAPEALKLGGGSSGLWCRACPGPFQLGQWLQLQVRLPAGCRAEQALGTVGWLSSWQEGKVAWEPWGKSLHGCKFEHPEAPGGARLASFGKLGPAGAGAQEHKKLGCCRWGKGAKATASSFGAVSTQFCKIRAEQAKSMQQCTAPARLWLKAQKTGARQRRQRSKRPGIETGQTCHPVMQSFCNAG